MAAEEDSSEPDLLGTVFFEKAKELSSSPVVGLGLCPAQCSAGPVPCWGPGLPVAADGPFLYLDIFLALLFFYFSVTL